MPQRREVVEKILELLPGDYDAAQAEQAWFWDIRRSGGYRLTAAGYMALVTANIDSWCVPISANQINKKTLLEMNRRIKWPYFIDGKNKQLVLFSSRDAVMAQLYGNVVAWVNSLSK